MYFHKTSVNKKELILNVIHFIYFFGKTCDIREAKLTSKSFVLSKLVVGAKVILTYAAHYKLIDVQSRTGCVVCITFVLQFIEVCGKTPEGLDQAH